MNRNETAPEPAPAATPTPLAEAEADAAAQEPKSETKQGAKHSKQTCPNPTQPLNQPIAADTKTVLQPHCAHNVPRKESLQSIRLSTVDRRLSRRRLAEAERAGRQAGRHSHTHAAHLLKRTHPNTIISEHHAAFFSAVLLLA